MMSHPTLESEGNRFSQNASPGNLQVKKWLTVATEFLTKPEMRDATNRTEVGFEPDGTKTDRVRVTIRKLRPQKRHRDWLLHKPVSVTSNAFNFRT